MSAKSGNSFGNFQGNQPYKVNGLKPITTEFSRGSVPNSLYAINRESAWTRWRRGYEIATATPRGNNYSYPFKYEVPFSPGTLPPGTTYPDMLGVFQGFPTLNKEFRVHWGAKKTEGSFRSDQNGDLYIESITEDSNNWYVKLNGTWSASNKLPPPFYIDMGPGLEGLKPLNGEILEDRVLVNGGPLIDRDTFNPQTQKRYGYVQAVLVDTNEETGILTLKKAGSVEATIDRDLVSPATRAPQIGRYLISGPRYCCTCQDFTRRQYSYMRNLGSSNKRAFPRAGAGSIKPGRYEVLKRLGIIDNSSMTAADVNRILQIIAPGSAFVVPDSVTTETLIKATAARDNPGIYSEFGYIYLRSTQNPAITGSLSEGMPSYEDYTSLITNPDYQSVPQKEITSLSDFWTPILDEMRYCKHIYAIRFQDDVFPPEPSDFPVEHGSMADWEEELIATEQKKEDKLNGSLAREALSYMDVPPYNCQAQAMQPMLQRLFNIPLTYIKIDGFTMYDKYGLPYVPALGQKPSQ